MLDSRRVPRQHVSLSAFAQAMRDKDPGFLQALAACEAKGLQLYGDALCVAAQAYYACWYEASFPDSLLAACRAIRTGQASPFCLCKQVSSERWDELNAYAIATQRWLGLDVLGRASISARQNRLMRLLGKRDPLRSALVRLYLWTLVAHLRYHVSLGQLCPDDYNVTGTYTDYSAWYVGAQGRLLGDPENESAEADKYLAEISRCHRGNEPAIQDLADRLVAGCPGGTQPACMHRFGRYQEIRIASIGALRWRGSLPDDPCTGAQWREIFATATRALKAWLRGDSAHDAQGRRIHEALGKHNPIRIAMVRHLLMRAPESSAFWEWLARDAEQHGRRPSDLF